MSPASPGLDGSAPPPWNPTPSAAPATGRFTPPPSGPSGTSVVIAAAAVAVVLLLVLGGLWAAGVGPFAHASGQRGPRTYSVARAEVLSAEGARHGGPWTLISAGGAGVSSPVSIPTANLSGANALGGLASLGCSVVLQTGLPATLGLPGQSITGSNGSLDAWFFVLKNSTNGVLFAVDLDGAVYGVATVGGGECSILFALLPTLPSSGIVDSPSVVSTALRNGGSAFVNAHPTANLSISLAGASTSFGFGGGQPATWTVQLTSCPLPPKISVNGSLSNLSEAWTAKVYASNGTLQNVSDSTISCSSAGAGGLGLLRSALQGPARLSAISLGLGDSLAAARRP